MKRPPRLFLALLAPFVLAWSASALAQNCANGKTMFFKTSASDPTACANSNCHGAQVNKNNIQNAAGNPSLIDAALAGSVTGVDNTPMLNLDIVNTLPLTESDVQDIAQWIFYAPTCPAPTPMVAANPTAAAFGSVNVGSSSSSQTITISNTGAGNATSMTYPSAPTNFTKSGTCSNGTLNAGSSCTLVFTFSPASAGSFTPTYTITGAGSISVPISLSGTGVAITPSLQASPSSAAFGSVVVGQSSTPQSITVTNSGGPASGVSISNPDAAEFLVTGNTCTTSLGAGASCTFNLAYKPSATGADNVTLTVSYTGGSTTVAMSGTGAPPPAPSLQAAPATLAFGNVSVGSTGAAQTLTISNTGGSSAAGVSIANGNAAKFPVSANTCGATIAAGASCTLHVAYAPSAAGADNANLTISYTGSAPLVVAMSGTGTTAPSANLGALPGSLSFGSITAGTTSSAQTLTVTNSGNAQATGIAFANNNAAEFVVSANTCGATLNTGASCTLNVAYAPNGTGTDSANLTISYAGGTSLVIALNGTGTAAATPSLQAAPPMVSFGNVAVGQTSSTTGITVTNSGGAAATAVAFVNSDAAEFVVSANTCGATVNAGASCTLNVAYSPSAAGADSATLTVNFAGGGALSISLSGAGVTPPPPGTGQLSMPTAVAMPDETLGIASPAHAVAVSNIGSASVTVSSIASSNAAEFAVSGSTCGSVSAGAGCSFSITFTPTAVGGRTTTITVTSSGAGSPQTIAVSGNGLSSSGGGGTTPPPPGTTAAAIEYYHAGFDHYFITAIQGEIDKLDNGTFVGWARTGHSFNVYPNAATGLNGVCRFFSTSFAPKSSHFYTPDAAECTTVKANPNWMFEAVVFYIPPPALDGSCPSGTNPVYRVYNNGQGAAPNHRYTTDLAVRATMLAQGWIPEGYGPIGVIMCTPP